MSNGPGASTRNQPILKLPRSHDPVVLEGWNLIERPEVPATGDRYWHVRLGAWIPVTGENRKLVVAGWRDWDLKVIRRGNGGPA